MSNQLELFWGILLGDILPDDPGADWSSDTVDALSETHNVCLRYWDPRQMYLAVGGSVIGKYVITMGPMPPVLSKADVMFLDLLGVLDRMPVPVATV